MESVYIGETHKNMAYGYTTGSCAAAAARAATMGLLTGIAPEVVCLDTPKGWKVKIPVATVGENDAYARELPLGKGGFCCMVKKDAGDDPDITNGIRVYAVVESLPVSDKGVDGKEAVKKATSEAEAGQYVYGNVAIDGGIGVGRVTRPGLNQPVGNAAINSAPRQMIEKEVREICEELEYQGDIKVTICIPEGVEIAKKTFNPRLGIEGGISVLGTSGIVEPMSKKALLDTIQVELNVVRKQGLETLVIAPGNMGMDYMKATYDYDLDRAVKCSNFVGETVDMAVRLGFKRVLYISHIGKAIKVAGGIMNTHSNEADCRMEILAAACLRQGLPAEAAIKILNMLTTEEAFCYLQENHMLTKVIPLLMQQIQAHLQKRSGDLVEIGVITFSAKLGELGKTENAISLLEQASVKTPGKLYGIGVGPGNPELMTVKAVKTIQAADVIAVPTTGSGKNNLADAFPMDAETTREESVAWQIAVQAVPEMQEKETLIIPMPMTKVAEKLEQAHRAGAEMLEACLIQGKNVAFLTLGDPSIYATYMYLHHRVAADGYLTELISGIPSFCAVAAKCGISLAEQQEQLHIIPASYDVKEALHLPGNKVFMKAGKEMQALLQTVKEELQEDYPIYLVENCGMEEEHIYTRLQDIPEKIGYFAILIIKGVTA